MWVSSGTRVFGISPWRGGGFALIALYAVSMLSSKVSMNAQDTRLMRALLVSLGALSVSLAGALAELVMTKRPGSMLLGAASGVGILLAVRLAYLVGAWTHGRFGSYRLKDPHWFWKASWGMSFAAAGAGTLCYFMGRFSDVISGHWQATGASAFIATGLVFALFLRRFPRASSDFRRRSAARAAWDRQRSRR